MTTEAEAIECLHRLMENLESGPLRERAMKAAARLHEATDTLNERLGEVEDALFEKQALPAGIRLGDNRGSILHWDGEYLTINRYHGDEISRIQLLKSSRELRMFAADKLRELIAKTGVLRG